MIVEQNVFCTRQLVDYSSAQAFTLARLQRKVQSQNGSLYGGLLLYGY
jgi:hypothetical protein